MKVFLFAIAKGFGHSRKRYVKDLCPRDKCCYRLMPPAYPKYDGPIRHRHSKIKAV